MSFGNRRFVLRLNGEGILDLGAVNTKALMEVLPALGAEFWTKSNAIREHLAVERKGNSVFLQVYNLPTSPVEYEDVHRFLSETGQMHAYRDPRYSEIWDVIARDIFPILARNYPGAVPINVQLATLPAGGKIPVHRDVGVLKDLHRMHVPLITNRGVSFFVGGPNDKYFLEEARLYELDNVVEHAVENRSEHERLHLLIDLLPADLGRAHVHDTEESFAAAVDRFRCNIGVTMLCRGAAADQEHGHILSMNFADQKIDAQRALSGPITGTNPRGGGRGFRGVAHSKDRKRIFVADYEKVNILSSTMEDLSDPISHPAMAHIHALSRENDTLWVVSTANDTVLGFSCDTGAFVGAWEFGVNEKNQPIATWNIAPARSVDQPGGSVFHLNAITCHNGMMYIGGLRTSGIFRMTVKGEITHLPGPMGTHDVVVVQDKLVSLDTVSRRIRVMDLDGNVISNTEVPTRFYGGGTEPQRPVRQGLAERGFLRGICAGSGDYAYVGTSPAAIIRFDTELGTFSQYSQFSDDPRWMIAGLCQIVMEETD